MHKPHGDESLTISCAEYSKDYLWAEDNHDPRKGMNTIHIGAHEEGGYDTSISLDKDGAAQLIAYLEEFFDLKPKTRFNKRYMKEGCKFHDIHKLKWIITDQLASPKGIAYFNDEIQADVFLKSLRDNHGYS